MDILKYKYWFYNIKMVYGFKFKRVKCSCGHITWRRNINIITHGNFSRQESLLFRDIRLILTFHNKMSCGFLFFILFVRALYFFSFYTDTSELLLCLLKNDCCQRHKFYWTRFVFRYIKMMTIILTKKSTTIRGIPHGFQWDRNGFFCFFLFLINRYIHTFYSRFSRYP